MKLYKLAIGIGIGMLFAWWIARKAKEPPEEPPTPPKKLLIILSNQYSDDIDIDNALAAYADAIHDEGWNTAISKLSPTITHFTEVEAIIKNINPYATMIVGEDTPMLLAQDLRNQDYASTVPFYTNDEYVLYPLDEDKYQIIGGIHRMDYPTSLIFPAHNDSYTTKKQEIANAFYKFATNRDNIGEMYGETIKSFLSVEGHGFADADTYKLYLSELGTLIHNTDPEQADVDNILNGRYKMIVAAGHGCPGSIRVKWIDSEPNAYFRATNHARLTKTPIIITEGCYTGGWWCAPCSDDILDPPYGDNWFGHQIFDNPDLRLITGGSPLGAIIPDVGRGGILPYIVTTFPEGKSLAESFKGKLFWGGGGGIFGDITFHY